MLPRGAVIVLRQFSQHTPKPSRGQESNKNIYKNIKTKKEKKKKPSFSDLPRHEFLLFVF